MGTLTVRCITAIKNPYHNSIGALVPGIPPTWDGTYTATEYPTGASYSLGGATISMYDSAGGTDFYQALIDVTFTDGVNFGIQLELNCPEDPLEFEQAGVDPFFVGTFGQLSILSEVEKASNPADAMKFYWYQNSPAFDISSSDWNQFFVASKHIPYRFYQAATWPQGLTPVPVPFNGDFLNPDTENVSDGTSFASRSGYRPNWDSDTNYPTVVIQSWTFSDGVTTTDPEITRTFEHKGGYLSTYSITDNFNRTQSISGWIIVGNSPPVARIKIDNICLLDYTFDGTDSTDPDGDTLSFAWKSWEVGTTEPVAPMATTAIWTVSLLPTTFYNIKLTVTDNDGATNSTQEEIVLTLSDRPSICGDGAGGIFTACPACMDGRLTTGKILIYHFPNGQSSRELLLTQDNFNSPSISRDENGHFFLSMQDFFTQQTILVESKDMFQSGTVLS